jgi:hypothetical protein
LDLDDYKPVKTPYLVGCLLSVSFRRPTSL